MALGEGLREWRRYGYGMPMAVDECRSYQVLMCSKFFGCRVQEFCTGFSVKHITFDTNQSVVRAPACAMKVIVALHDGSLLIKEMVGPRDWGLR